MGARVLVVGAPGDRPWTDALEAEGHRVEVRSTVQEALSVFGSSTVGCVVVETEAFTRGRPPRGEAASDGGTATEREAPDPLDAVASVREFGHDVPVVLVSAEPDGELAAAATRRGVSEYYPRSATDDSLAERVVTHARSHDAEQPSSDGAASRPAGPGDPATVIDDPATALEAVSDGLYVLDLDGRFVEVNEALAAMTGYEAAELRGEHVSTITTESAAESVFPAVRRIVEGETDAATVSTTVVPRDGEPFPAEDHVTAVREDGEVVGIAGVIRDVSAKRERTRELERYEATIEAVDDAVYLLDDEGQFELVNDALVELSGFDREALLGEHTSIIKDEQTVQRAENKLRDLIAGNAAETTFELDLQPKSGDSIEAEDHMAMLTDEDGAFDGTAGVIRDITERKERERELRRARERFADLLESSRALLGAHSREQVAEIVADAVAETLGYDLNIVRLYDAEADALEPVAGSGEGDVALAERPTYDADEGRPGAAFQAGAVRLAPDDFDIEPGDLPGPAESTLYVPLGDQGLVSIGATEPDAFDEQALSLAEILASNAAVALDRVSYENELVQYRTVLENVQDMVYVADEAGRITLATEPLAAWLGVERDDLAGRRVDSLLADGSVLDEGVPNVGADEPSRPVEAEFERADGESLPGELERSPLPAEEGFSGTVGVVRDRSELVETRERLETQRDRFTYLFDNLPDAVVEAALDEEGRPIVSTVNDAFEDVFGYDPATITGESLNEYILPEGEREAGRKLDRAAAEGDVVQREVRRKTADGYRDFLFRGVPYDTGDDGINSFGIYTDITDQKERERRLQVLNRVLRHNLRNDLNVVLGYAEMIAGRVDDETVDDWAETLIETASDVASLSDRARSLDRTMREGSLRDRSVGLRPLVADVADEYREQYPEATIEVDVDEVAVVGDGRIELALTELLENSVEYGGEQVHVRVETDLETDRVALRVADNGTGIPEYEREVVDESTEITQLEHGSGLGLWIVRWVCDSCGGRLSFEDSDLGGTAVVLSLTPADAE